MLTRLSEIFEGKDEADVARKLYVEKLSVKEAAKLRKEDRQTTTRYRDSYVIRAALLAAEHGLVKMSDYTDERGG